MPLRTGRLIRGYFKIPGRISQSSLRWGREILRSSGVMPSTVWFSLDTRSELGQMVNWTDFDAGVATDLMAHLRDDEAVLVATEHAVIDWRASHPDVLDVSFEGCELIVAISDLAGMQGYLLVAGRLWVLNGAPSLGLHRVERVDDPAAVLRLLIDE